MVEAGLYRLHPTVLTPEGERIRDDLETRMARYLREMQLQVRPVGREPRQALMTAVIGVAVGRKVLTKEAELQLVGKQVDSGEDGQSGSRDMSGEHSTRSST